MSSTASRTVKAIRGERGQSLTETVLALPLLLFLFMGLLQLLALGWASLLSGHAIHAAARVYSVRHADDEGRAAELAQDTAVRIMAKAWPRVAPQVSVLEAGPNTCHLKMSAWLTPLWGWRWALKSGTWLRLDRDAYIQDEATQARRTEDEFRPRP